MSTKLLKRVAATSAAFLAIGSAGAMGLSTAAGAATVRPVAAHSVPGCKDSSYSCGYREGYLRGFSDGRMAKKAGLCASKRHSLLPPQLITLSDQGYADGYTKGFEHYCPS